MDMLKCQKIPIWIFVCEKDSENAFSILIKYFEGNINFLELLGTLLSQFVFDTISIILLILNWVRTSSSTETMERYPYAYPSNLISIFSITILFTEEWLSNSIGIFIVHGQKIHQQYIRTGWRRRRMKFRKKLEMKILTCFSSNDGKFSFHCFSPFSCVMYSDALSKRIVAS